MKIRDTNKSYFYFKLEENDFKRYGYYRCRQFLNALQKELAAGDRYWIKKAKMWAIKKERRETFNRLINRYLEPKQEELFHE